MKKMKEEFFYNPNPKMFIGLDIDGGTSYSFVQFYSEHYTKIIRYRNEQEILLQSRYKRMEK